MSEEESEGAALRWDAAGATHAVRAAAAMQAGLLISEGDAVILDQNDERKSFVIVKRGRYVFRLSTYSTVRRIECVATRALLTLYVASSRFLQQGEDR
eukprot:4743369-Pyramimonas_sp.AAC.1